MDKHIDYLRITLAAEHQLSHASNIIRKWNAAISDDERKVLTSIVPHYVRYLKAMLSPKKFNKNAVYEKVELLNNYYNFIHIFETKFTICTKNAEKAPNCQI